MNNSSRPVRVIFPALVGAVAMVVALWFIWTISKGHLDIGGGHPDTREFATVQSVAQRGTEGFCHNVFVTPEATWLIGVVERQRSDLEIPDTATDLAKLIEHDGEPRGSAMASTGLFGGGMRSKKRYGYISRLGENGEFEVVAYLGSAACMEASPDEKRVYVLSGMERPDDAYTNDDPASDQDAVFVSDDQGKSWRWQREGFLVPASQRAWGVDAYADAYDTLWAWENLPRREVLSGDAILDGEGSGLYYSTDQGRTTTEVPQPSPLVSGLPELHAQLPEGMQFEYETKIGDITPHIARFGPDRAGVWVSQTIAYYSPTDSSPCNNGVLRMTRYAELTREDGEWRMGKIQYKDRLDIEAIRQGPDGRIRAIARLPGKTDKQVARIDPDTLQLSAVSDVPGAFEPLDSSVSLRSFSVGAKSMVVNISSAYAVPKWINMTEWVSGKSARISGSAIFYSVDDGESWHRLAIPGYQGVMGFDPDADRLFWGKERYYEGDKAIQVDHLAGD